MEDPTDALRLTLARAAQHDKGVARLLARADSLDPDRLSAGDVCADAGFPRERIEALIDDARARGDEMRRWRDAGWRAIALPDPDYPPLLARIPDPPAVLLVRGEPAWLHSPQLALVGTRKPSADGRVNAFAFARELAAAGFCVTSGLALGIDGRAHEGALDTGATLAVLGSGPDRIYPARHRDLAERVAGSGALVTEFPPGAPPRAHHFPRRNRIISGLALATIVVEATPRSGSLITARLAAEQGREVLAVPGSIHNAQSRGCHGLLRDGAGWMESVADLRQALEPMRMLSDAVERPVPGADEPAEEADPVLAAFTAGVNHPDELHERTGLDASELSRRLTELEFEGRIERVPGGFQRLYSPRG